MFNWKKIARSLLAFSLVVAMTLTGCGKPPDDSLLHPCKADQLVEAVNSGIQGNYPENADKFTLRPAKKREKDGASYYESDYGMTLKIYTDKYKRVEQIRTSYVPDYPRDDAGIEIYSTLAFINSYLAGLLTREENNADFEREFSELMDYYSLYFDQSFIDPDFNYVLNCTAGKMKYRYVFTPAAHEFDIIEDADDLIPFQKASRRFLEYIDPSSADPSVEPSSVENEEPTPTADDSAIEESPANQEPESIESKLDSPIPLEILEAAYTSGMYKVGTDLPSGEYVLLGDMEHFCYYQISSDSSGELESIIANDNYGTFRIVRVNDGEYLSFTNSFAIPADSVTLSKFVNKDGYFIGGQYRVGIDIPAGEYKLELSAESAYWQRASSPNSTLENIIANDNISAPTYVSLNEGEYFLITGANFKLSD